MSEPQGAAKWNETLMGEGVRQVAKELCGLLQGMDKCSLQAVKKKYTQSMYLEVANIKLE